MHMTTSAGAELASCPATREVDLVSVRSDQPGPVASALIRAIRVYQRFLSPTLGKNCRFQPTCSLYAAQAISQHGVIKGITLAVVRLGKCHPLHEGGYDPVPNRDARTEGDDK